MKERRCLCISSNQPKSWQTVPNVVLRTPYVAQPTISVDACIENAIQALWDQGIETLECCCGHGGENPSVIVPNGATREDAERARKVIRQVDVRSWTILSWNLVRYEEE